MEAFTVNLYDEIKGMLIAFQPESPVTHELKSRLQELEEPVCEIGQRNISGSCRLRAVMSQLEQLKSGLGKLALRCSRNIGGAARDRTEVDQVESLMARCKTDLEALIAVNPRHTSNELETDLTKLNPIGPSTNLGSEKIDKTPRLSDDEIDGVLLNKQANEFYRRHFSESRKTTITASEMRDLLKSQVQPDDLHLLTEIDQAVQQLITAETLSLEDLNDYFTKWLAEDTYILKPDELSYSGGVQSRMKHGSGQLKMKNGTFYSGEFQMDKKSGKGTCTWRDCKEYVGDWKDDMMNGLGILTQPNGRKYEGEFRNDMRHGKGVYISSDGRHYTGDFVDNMMEGYGVILSPDGKRYEGEFKANKKHGVGVHYWPDSARYIGEFRHDMKHGKGQFFETDGRIIEGEWVEDKLLN